MPPAVEPNYFTCTLGEATQRRKTCGGDDSFSSVIDLIDRQALDNPELPAIGFSTTKEPQSQDGEAYLTFRQLSMRSLLAAYHLRENFPEYTEDNCTGLLCTSSLEFVLTWLALTRIGTSVLLLAPQLEAKAIEQLCKTLSVQTIFIDARQESRCASVADGIDIVRIPEYDRAKPTTNDSLVSSHNNDEKLALKTDIALYFHSSGTSTGLPKAIPQSHRGLISALPRFPGSEKPSTFSTTPLYHGGLADALRAWASGALAWFFPEGEAPITTANVCKAVKYARGSNIASVGYFSSVPFILQMLSLEQKGLDLLQSMDLVGVGGAALTEVTGNILVQQGVRLLSRMGSAECGFLMSSHRDYEHDKEWQFLRPLDDPSILEFEPREDQLSELVVRSGWPHLAKINREDGSYATSDLYEPHRHQAGLWRYHSRADAQITLTNGKKFDPSPLEASILASTKLFSDVLIFGNGREYPGALMIPSNNRSVDELVERIWPKIEILNAESQNHAKISKHMIIIAQQADPGLEKSSKGTILRNKAEARFAEEIEGAYSQIQHRIMVSDTATYDEVYSAVIDCFSRTLGRSFDPEQDLYGQGVDSMSCLQIRGMIQNSCLPKIKSSLPLNVVYDNATINKLVSYLWHLRQTSGHGGAASSFHTDGNDDLQEMRDMVAKYTKTVTWSAPRPTATGEVIVLTGSTGFLGCHLLSSLLTNARVESVICLIRAKSISQARARLAAALRRRGCADLSDSRVICAPCNLSESNLGLSEEVQSMLATSATLFIHSAWTVNFSLRFSSFEDQVRGTANLLALAARAGARMVFISSIASISRAGHSPTPEIISTNPADASPLGYSQSKWVAEQICASAADRGEPDCLWPPCGTILIIRVGQLCGDQGGIWNETEAYPLMLSTAKITGCLPDFKDAIVNWMPVHLAAQIVHDIAFHALDRRSLGEPTVFHVHNYHNTPLWNDMLGWLQEDSKSWKGSSFEVVPSSRWISAMESATLKGGREHPAYALLGLWKRAFESTDERREDTTGCSSTSRSQKVSPAMQRLQPLSQEQLIRMWRWVNKAFP